MGFWFSSPKRIEDETILLSGRTIFQIGERGRATAGKLYLTDKRLIFAPTHLELLLRASRWSRRRAEILHIQKTAQSLASAVGELHPPKRFMLKMSDDEEVFVKASPKIIALIEALT